MSYMFQNRLAHLFLTAIILSSLIIGVFGEDLSITNTKPYQIGVLLPASGESAMDFYKTMNWTAQGLEREGIGTSIELLSYDTSIEPVYASAQELLENPDIHVVIGPATSDELVLLAPEFIRAKKLLISPSATSGAISELFGSSGYIRRTTTGDQVQMRIIMDLLAERGAESVALLSEKNTYGRTFTDWADVYASEFGLALTNNVALEPEIAISDAVIKACQDNPDYLIVAARSSYAAEIAKMVQENYSDIKLFFTDAARTETFIELAGTHAEGLEGVSPTADKKTGFIIAYQDHFKELSSDYASHTRDALVLAVATLAQMEANPSETPGEAFASVVSGEEISVSWDDQGAAQAVGLIRAGYLPDITGASGPLDYIPDQGLDPVTTWYVNWHIEEGEFLADRYISGGKEIERDISPEPATREVKPAVNIPPHLLEEKGDVISFVYSGEKGDFGFTDQAYSGLLKAKRDFNLSVREFFLDGISPEPDPVTDERTGKRARVVLMLGFYLTDYAKATAEKYPDTQVIVVDADPVEIRGVKTASFSMHGASYLAGILAANQSATGNIGVIAGREASVISSFTDGFIAGAIRENPDCSVTIRYIAEDNTGFHQPERAAVIAEEMHRNGTDIIFTVAGESGLGAISAAKRLPGLHIIGVDSDQSYLGPGVVIASVVKNLESVVYQEIAEGLIGSDTGLIIYGLENNGASLAINPRLPHLTSVINNRIEEAGNQERSYTLPGC